jgi:hypothetical protein
MNVIVSNIDLNITIYVCIVFQTGWQQLENGETCFKHGFIDFIFIFSNFMCHSF